MRTRFVLVIAAALVAGGATAAVLATRAGDEQPAAYRGSIPPVHVQLPDFALRDSTTGVTIRSAALEGKVVLITFLDTQCRSSCPIIASQIGLALDKLTPGQLRDVVPIAITSDPPEDTPASVRTFLRRHRVEGRLHYLTGSVDELRPVWENFQVAASFDTGEDDLHSAPVRIYDRSGIWASTLHAGADLSPEKLAHDLTIALNA